MIDYNFLFAVIMCDLSKCISVYLHMITLDYCHILLVVIYLLSQFFFKRLFVVIYSGKDTGCYEVQILMARVSFRNDVGYVNRESS